MFFSEWRRPFLHPGGDSLDSTNGTRELEWYSLIDRGARDRECEQNSKTSPETSGGGGGLGRGVRAEEGGVWWSGGTEPENCIACSVISLPPGSHSLHHLL